MKYLNRKLKMKNDIIIITGFSGAGKDSIAKDLSKIGYEFIISYTTRPKKDNEVDGKDYYFVKDSFMKPESFIEIREYKTVNGIWKYGIHKNSISENKPYVCVMDMQGAKTLKNIFGTRVTIFFIDVNKYLRLNRAMYRDGNNFSMKEWNRRAKDDKKIKKNIDKDCDYIVSNEFFSCSICVKHILKLLNK